MAVIFLQNGKAIECRECFIDYQHRVVKAVTEHCNIIPFESILYIELKKKDRAKIVSFALAVRNNGQEDGET